jgi:acetyl-CoA carboxylase biotin carboxyl carrier protein
MIEEEDKMAIDIVAHMPGTISMIMVNVGDKVQADDELLVLEAMKMENPICAKNDGIVKEIKVKENDKVAINQVLIVLE